MLVSVASGCSLRPTFLTGSQATPGLLLLRLHLHLASHSAFCIHSVQFSCSIVSNSLQPHGLQHVRPPCLSPTPGVYSNSCPSGQWCHPIISSSVVPFSSSHLQSFPALGSFPMSQLFAWGGQSTGVSALASFLLERDKTDLTWGTKQVWSRKWQPTPVFLPGEPNGQRSLVGCTPRGRSVRHDWETEQSQFKVNSDC